MQGCTGSARQPLLTIEIPEWTWTGFWRDSKKAFIFDTRGCNEAFFNLLGNHTYIFEYQFFSLKIIFFIIIHTPVRRLFFILSFALRIKIKNTHFIFKKNTLKKSVINVRSRFFSLQPPFFIRSQQN